MSHLCKNKYFCLTSLPHKSQNLLIPIISMLNEMYCKSQLNYRIRIAVRRQQSYSLNLELQKTLENLERLSHSDLKLITMMSDETIAMNLELQDFLEKMSIKDSTEEPDTASKNSNPL